MSEELTEFLYIASKYAAALIGFGFIFLIVLRLFSNSNYLKKSLVSFITGAILVLITAFCIMGDKFKLFEKYNDLPVFGFNKAFFTYYSFFFVAILYTIVLPIIYLCIGKSRHQQFKTYKIKIEKDKKKNIKPTVVEKKESVLVCFKHNDNYLLKKAYNLNSGDYYSALIKKLEGKIIFHDEMVNKIIEEYNLDGKVLEKKLSGEITVKKNKDMHYYCYCITISEISDKLTEYEEIDPYVLVNYELDELNKQAIYHIILRDYFNIEI